MRRPRYLDYQCPTCTAKHTRFVETNDDDTPLAKNDDGPIASEVCGAYLGGISGTGIHYAGPRKGEVESFSEDITCDGVLVPIDPKFQGYMKTITKGNHDFNERERARLEKRGDEHWKREGRHEAIERERAMLKRNGMEGAGGVK